MATKLQEMIGTVERLLKLGEANPFSTDVTEAINREGVLFALRYLRNLDIDVRSDENVLAGLASQVEHLTARVASMEHIDFNVLTRNIDRVTVRVMALERLSH